MTSPIASRLFVVAAVAVAVSATSAFAQSQGPADRFVGVWELKPDARILKDEPANYSLTRAIAWDGKVITETDTVKNGGIVGIKLPDSRTALTVTTDGVERPAPGLNRIGPMPSQSVAAASWQGDNLVIKGNGQDAFGFWRFDRRAFLSPDGEQMTEITITSSSFGDSEQTSVFARKH